MNFYDRSIRQCFWVFFFFLLTEGIFRRWLLPGLSNVFLVIRDPFVLYAFVLGLQRGYVRHRDAQLMLVLGILSFFSTIILGHGNLFVALFGVRIILLYFPFMYICSHVLSRHDILIVGKIFVLMIIPMVVLNIIQFYSPQSAWVNRGIGGDESGAGFSGAMGYYRPPGIFTFIAGLTDFYFIAYGFLLYFLINREEAQRMGLARPLLLCSLIAYFISIPVSISRTHFVQTFITSAFFLYMFPSRKKLALRILQVLLLLAIVAPIAMMNKDVQLFVEVFDTRFSGANKSEGNLATSAVDRSFGWGLKQLDIVPIFGYGSGMFTNVGTRYLFNNDIQNAVNMGIPARVYGLSEMELGRILAEDGLLLGLCIIFVRFRIAISLFLKALRQWRRRTNALAWLMLPFALTKLVTGQLKTPFHLAFTTVAVIALLVALRTGKPRRIPRSTPPTVMPDSHRQDAPQTP